MTTDRKEGTGMTRQIVVVDVETNGLNPSIHVAVEVAWRNQATGARGLFVPIHNVAKVLAAAEIRALQINRYIDRIAEAEQDTGYVELNRLYDQLDGNTLAGANPSFDARFLEPMFDRAGRVKIDPWHHRLWDLSASAATKWKLKELPGLSTICERLRVDPPDHTAEGDVTATARCFEILMKEVERDRVTETMSDEVRELHDELSVVLGLVRQAFDAPTAVERETAAYTLGTMLGKSAERAARSAP